MAQTDSQYDFFSEMFSISTHETSIFPDNTNLTCTLTAHENANTWSSWVEIQDSGTTKLTSKFTSDGHISSAVIESLSEIDTIYMLEISYGSSNDIVSRWRFAGSTKFQNPAHQNRVRGIHIPAGQAIYYRMKTATAVADTAMVHFRYFLH